MGDGWEDIWLNQLYNVSVHHVKTKRVGIAQVRNDLINFIWMY